MSILIIPKGKAFGFFFLHHYTDVIIFTGLGILGTFLGLTIGLNQIDLSSIEHMQTGIAGLLSGTVTAFWTSVAGLIIAIPFNLIYSFIMRRFELSAERIDTLLDQLFPSKNHMDLLQEQVNATREQKEVMEQLNSDLVTRLGELLENLADNINQSLNDNLDRSFKANLIPVLEKLNASIETLSNSAGSSLSESIQKGAGSQIASLASALETMQKQVGDIIAAGEKASNGLVKTLEQSQAMMEMISRTMTDGTNQQKEDLTIASNTIKQTLEEILAKVEQNLNQGAGAVQSNLEILKQAQEETRQIIQEAGAAAEQFQQASIPMQQVADTLGNQINAVLSDSRRFNQQVENTVKLLAETSQNNKEEQDLVKRSLEETRAAWASYEEHFKGLSGELQRTFEILDKGMRQYNNETQKLLTEALEKYDHSIAMAMSQMAGLNDELREALEDFNAERKAVVRR